MEGYQIVLLLLAFVVAFIVLRSLMKPAESSTQTAVTTVQLQANKHVPERKDLPRRSSSSRSVDEDDDFGTSLALGMATGIPLGRNLPAGLLGAMMNESSKNDVHAEDQRPHDRHDSGNNHSHSSGGESHSHSYGGSDSGGSSSYGGSDSSSSGSSGGGGGD